MSSSSKQKGTRAEVAVVDYLRLLGFDVYRTPAGANKDIGDIVGIPGVTIQVKDQQQHKLGMWMRQLAEQMANSNASFGILVVKCKGKSNPAEWFWIFHGTAHSAAIEHLMKVHFERKGRG